MKNFKLSTSDLWQSGLVVVGIVAACFNTEIRTLIISAMERWQIILLVFSVTGLFFLILKIWVRGKIDGKFAELEAHNKQLSEGIKYSQDHHNITGRIMREVVLPACMNDESTREAVAQILYRQRHNAPELRKWGMDEDVVKRLLRIYHENQANNLTANITPPPPPPSNSQPAQPPTP